MFIKLPVASVVSVLSGSDPAGSVWGILLLIAGGLLAIVKGGDLFTDSSVHIARMSRIPPVIVGATIVSTATSFPEFMVSLTGTLAGSAEFAVGNVIGSCLCNIGLIIGVCAVIRGVIAKRTNSQPGISASRAMLAGPGMFMLGTAVLTCVFSWFDAGGITSDGQPVRFGFARWQAGILLVGMVWYLAWSARQAGRARYETSLSESADTPKVTLLEIVRVSGVFVLACGIVVIGSRLLVTNGESLALMLGVPKLVLGLTLFAVGTSLPELTISLIAVLKGHEALGIGNIVGSNVLNICWVLGTCAVIRPLPIELQTVVVDLPVTLLLTVMMVVLPWKSERISTAAGWALLTVYLLHLVGVTTLGVL
ncbi:MAG: calcium/sodium antiporter [Planctomycetaceae bacterium]